MPRRNHALRSFSYVNKEVIFEAEMAMVIEESDSGGLEKPSLLPAL
jgi:hypothetical protein